MSLLMYRRFFAVTRQIVRVRLLLTVVLILAVFVTTNSQEQMSREVRVSVYNMECKETFDAAKNKELFAAQNYEGWQVKFGEQTVTMDRRGQATVNLTYVKDEFAPYNVSVIVPNDPKAKLFIIYYNDWNKDRDGTVRLLP